MAKVFFIVALLAVAMNGCVYNAKTTINSTSEQFGNQTIEREMQVGK